MTNSIAEYFLDELYDWKSAIDLYLEETEDSEEWLRDILRFDSVPQLSAKVEHYLNRILLSRQNLLYLRTFIESFEKQLYKDETPETNEMITQQQRDQQKQLREDMHKVEKEYLDLRYACDEFLASAVDLQSNIQGHASR